MTENANILIVDDDNNSALDLKTFLERKDTFGEVECASSVAEATEYLQIKPMDVVVLDLVMSMNDGYSFLERLPRLSLLKRPDVIVASAINHEHAIRKAFDLGARYYMIKPFEHEIVYKRIVDVLDISEPGSAGLHYDAPVNTDQRIMEIFLTLGLPPHLKGYQYLKEAVKMTLSDPSIIYSITKRLYPAIAEKFEVTPTKVELAIRHTLDVAWQRSRMENMDKLFGCEVYLKDVKPTNGEFIALVADKLATDSQG